MDPISTATFNEADSRFMARALKLARRGRYGAHPNPMVGCVIVRDDAIVGEGWHALAGEGHAEVNALSAAGEHARGGTAYVTLEPCAHHGKTPPCCDALIDAGIARVVAAMQDPFAQVDGAGFDSLRAAGVQVDHGLLEIEARALNEAYLFRLETGRPYVRLKVAASLDGATAMASGESQWITGEAARADVHRLRAASGAILTGIATVTADDPALTARTDEPGVRQPLRAVVDSALKMPSDAKLLREEGTTVVYCVDDRRRAELESAGAEVVRVAASGWKADLGEVLNDLGRREVNAVLVEAGAILAGSLLAEDRVDELVIYQAPHIMGSETRGMVSTPDWAALDDRRHLEIIDVRRFGDDTRITARPRRSDG